MTLAEAQTVPMEVITMNEREHDEALKALWFEAYKARRNLDWYTEMVRRNRRVDEVGHAEAKAKFAEAVEAIDDHEAAYTGWVRFWLVLNTNGHIHRGTNCSTCFPTTEFDLLPELSGLTEAEAVDAHGAILCTVCFPTAPVEWTNGKSKASIEAKAQRAADKAAREAKRLEKALLPNGEPLVVFDANGRWPERIVTLAAAKSWLTSAYEWDLDHPSYTLEAVAEVAAAVAAKTGESVDKVRADAAKRAAKRK